MKNGSAISREDIPCGNSLHGRSVVERVDDGRDIYGLRRHERTLLIFSAIIFLFDAQMMAATASSAYRTRG